MRPCNDIKFYAYYLGELLRRFFIKYYFKEVVIMTFKRIITVVLLACFTMALLTAMPTYAMADSPTLSWEEKIDSAIWNTTPDENGRYLVYVSRTGVDSDKIEKEFNRRNEFSLSDYQDKATYRRKVGPSVALLAIEKYGMYNSLQLDYGRELFNDELAPIEYELIENYNEFIMNKRTVITDLYGTYNQSFADKFNIASDLVLYEGQYTGSYVLYATRDEIEAMAKDSSIEGIMVWEEYELQPKTHLVQSQIHTDYGGTKGTAYNNGSGYKGTGIKIGVIETGGFMTNARQLRSIIGSKLYYVDASTGLIAESPNNDAHATKITSVIVGEPVSYNGYTYEGIVPEATVYQGIGNTPSSMVNLIQHFATKYGVSVINDSLGNTDGAGAYTLAFDLETDRIINSTGITFVVCAGQRMPNGNTQYNVESPGLAYNAITVGAISTKSGENVLKNPTYYMWGNSAYNEATYMTNKPDIVAPGTYISYMINDNAPDYDTGTSLSAPIVTGVVAQMFQADETLMGNPTKTKAILLAGADPTVVSTSGNAEAFTDSELIREKSGLGMVNAINSVRIAEAGDNNSAGTTLYLDATSTANHTGTLEDSIHLEGGQTIRIVLTFNKPDGQTVSNSGYQYNTALKLYRGTEPEETSSFVYSNVQVIEYTVPEDKAGTYSIKHTVFRFALISQPLQWRIYAAWRVIPSDD